MRIPRDAIFDPGRNAAFAVPALALSLFVFAYSVRLGQVSILAFYACWLPPLVLAPRLLVARPGPVAALLVLPTLASLSVLWSDVPATTLRAAIQYGTTIVCGIVAARLVSARSLALGATAGGLAVLLYSIAHGRYAYDVVDGTYAFVGAFGSKNQLGFFAALTLVFAAAVLFVVLAGLLERLFALATAALALGLLSLSDSAAAVISTGVAFVAVALMRFIVALQRHGRAAVIFALAGAGLLAAAVAIQLGALEALLGAFGRDTTLTGRTYLWRRGWEFASLGGWPGLGYGAFWTLGRPEAEELWRAFYIDSRTGFHFHNTFIEAFVALGVPGLALTIATGLALLVAPAVAALRRAGGAETVLLSGLSLMFLARAMVEVDFLTPYTVGSFLVPFVLLRLVEGAPQGKAPAATAEQIGGSGVARPSAQGIPHHDPL